jgi:hypothetical protein
MDWMKAVRDYAPAIIGMVLIFWVMYSVSVEVMSKMCDARTACCVAQNATSALC